MKNKQIALELLIFFLIVQCACTTLHAQFFPNPNTLSTGQGTIGQLDPIWTVSQWYNTNPGSPNGSGPVYTPALIQNNCAPGSWANPLPGANWITGQGANCNLNAAFGFRYFRLTLDLPADCNGISVTNPNSFVLDFDGYVDNNIIDIYVNGNPTGISGSGFTQGFPISIQLVGPWLVGLNTIDILVENSPGGASNPYGLLLQANTTAPSDNDGDGYTNDNDVCPCEFGSNPFGCEDPSLHNCDIDAIRNALANENVVELPHCSDDCSVYFLNKTPMSGAQAQAYANLFGANLISIQNQAENDCIMNALNNLNDPTVSSIIWIGFSDEVQEGTFVWYDQASITYTNWAAGEPNNSGNEDCTQIYPNGLWNDLPCNIGNAQSIIEFNLCPVANGGSDLTICLNDTAPLLGSSSILGSAPYTYAWSNGVNTLSNPVSPTQNTDYILTTTDRYSCVTHDTVSVIVNPLPVVDAPADTAICLGESLSLSGSGAINYTWDNGITNGILFSPNQTLTYTVTGTDANGCEDTSTVSVGILPLPNVFAGNDTALCFNSEYMLYGSGAETYSWDNGITDSVSFYVSATTTYTLTGTDSNGCVQSDQVIVTVNPNPIVDAGIDQAICINEDVTLSGSGAQSYTWDNGVTDAQAFFPTQTLTYTVIGTDLNSCNDTDQVVVTVHNLPLVDAGTDFAVCIGDPATLSGSGANTYVWDNGVTDNIAFFPNNTLVYTVIGTDLNDCSNTDQITVTVHPLPAVNAGSDQQICEGSSISLQGSGAISYVWSGNISDGIPFIPLASGIYTVTGTDANQCQNTDQVMVNVVPYPIPGFTTNSPAQVDIKPLVIQTTTANYTSVDYYTNGIFIGSGSQVIHSFQNPGWHDITQIATNIMCVDSITMSVEVEPGAQIFIPNSYTPGRKDNLNDVWKPMMSYLSDYNLRIFDRWGNIILDSKNIYEGWNGGYHNDISKPVHSGTYVYRIDYRHMDGVSKQISGHINLIR